MTAPDNKRGEQNGLEQLPIQEAIVNALAAKNITALNPVQKKAVEAGLFEHNIVVCAPTASGKTLIATLAISHHLLHQKGKIIYLVPLRALAAEKFREYKGLFQETAHRVAVATGDIDSPSEYLAENDIIILTVEKANSLIRHRASWLKRVSCVVIDEAHLLNDTERGPTLEIVLTALKTAIHPHLIALSATIGNPKELAHWLDAKLVMDTWRPVELKKGIYYSGKMEFYEK